MVFSSVIFLFRFLPVFFFVYYLVPGRMKNFILLLGSLFFYAWGEPVYVSLMLFSTVSDYIHGRLIDRYRGRIAAKAFLVSSIVINLLLLGFFKYSNLNLPLPIGISFYTFQTMSYSIDVYRGEAKVQKNILDFGVFVTMFPQLIAGPIVTYREVQESIRERNSDILQISYGVKRFVVGLAKKVLIANNIGILWSEISAMNFATLSVLTAWIGILAYAFQIYFDFSGYSDMAIGLGACLGFKFPENFKYPYISLSITEFWRRWHMTLGGWFREYVYIPLGGNRKGVARQMVNILIVWMLTGIWHGAGFNFLLWGLWYAVFLILEKLFLLKVFRKLPNFFGLIYTCVVVLVGWVFFTVESAEGIRGYLEAMFGMNGVGLFDARGLFLGREYLILFIIAFVAATPLVRHMVVNLEYSRRTWGTALYRLGEKVILPVLLLLSIAYVVDASYNPFLYFRF